MPDQKTVKVRNISPYGQVDSPEAGGLVDAGAVIDVPPELGERLVHSGHYEPVGSFKPRTAEQRAADEYAQEQERLAKEQAEAEKAPADDNQEKPQ